MALKTKEEIENAITSITKAFKDAKKEIINELKKKKLYDIEGNEKVFLDIETGLLWLDYEYYRPGKAVSVQEGKKIVAEMNLGFEGFRLPKITELKKLIEKGYLDNYPLSQAFLTCNEARSLLDLKGRELILDYYITGFVLPCSDILFEKARIDKKVYSDAMKNNPNKGYELAYSLITKNSLLLKFEDKKLNKLFKDYLITVPELRQKLKDMKNGPETPAEIPLLDHNNLIASYPLADINASLYDYAINAEKWCSSLRNRINDLESKNAELFSDINKYADTFQNGYTDSDVLSDEENSLFRKGYDTISAFFDTRLEQAKEMLKKNASEFRNLNKRLYEASISEDNIAELGRIEAEPRPGFILYTQMTLDAVNRSYSKLSAFIRKKEAVVYLSKEFADRYNTYLSEITDGRENYIRSCRSSRISDDISAGWADELRNNMVIQLKAFIAIITYSLHSSKSTPSMYKKLCEILSDHISTIRSFYLNNRKDIYIKHAVRASDSDQSLLDKIDAEAALYEATGEFRKRICDLICNSSEAEAGFIIDNISELYDMPLTQLASIEDNSSRKIIASETYDKLEALRKKNFEKLKEDAKLFAAEQEKRDTAFNTLLYEMQQDLRK